MLLVRTDLQQGRGLGCFPRREDLEKIAAAPSQSPLFGPMARSISPLSTAQRAFCQIGGRQHGRYRGGQVVKDCSIASSGVGPAYILARVRCSAAHRPSTPSDNYGVNQPQVRLQPRAPTSIVHLRLAVAGGAKGSGKGQRHDRPKSTSDIRSMDSNTRLKGAALPDVIGHAERCVGG